MLIQFLFGKNHHPYNNFVKITIFGLAMVGNGLNAGRMTAVESAMAHAQPSCNHANLKICRGTAMASLSYMTGSSTLVLPSVKVVRASWLSWRVAP